MYVNKQFVNMLLIICSNQLQKINYKNFVLNFSVAISFNDMALKHE